MYGNKLFFKKNTSPTPPPRISNSPSLSRLSDLRNLEQNRAVRSRVNTKIYLNFCRMTQKSKRHRFYYKSNLFNDLSLL